MARTKGSKCRLCRREGIKLYLKGARCLSEKCAISKKAQVPGQHGNSRKKLSEYGVQMREKQKAKRIYGVLEKQFKNYVQKALNTKGVSGDILVKELESRLDNLVYRSGFSVSRAKARQLIRSGVFTVDGRTLTIPSAQIKENAIIKPTNMEKVHLREAFTLPEWLEANVKEKFIKVVKLPRLDEYSEPVNIQLIIEFYSR